MVFGEGGILLAFLMADRFKEVMAEVTWRDLFLDMRKVLIGSSMGTLNLSRIKHLSSTNQSSVGSRVKLLPCGLWLGGFCMMGGAGSFLYHCIVRGSLSNNSTPEENRVEKGVRNKVLSITFELLNLPLFEA